MTELCSLPIEVTNRNTKKEFAYLQLKIQILADLHMLGIKKKRESASSFKFKNN